MRTRLNVIQTRSALRLILVSRFSHLWTHYEYYLPGWEDLSGNLSYQRRKQTTPHSHQQINLSWPILVCMIKKVWPTPTPSVLKCGIPRISLSETKEKKCGCPALATSVLQHFEDDEIIFRFIGFLTFDFLKQKIRYSKSRVILFRTRLNRH